jgi:hypothetical protein
MSRVFRREGGEVCAVQMADHSFAILQDRVMELMRDGTFAPGNAACVAEAIWAMLHGVTALLLDQADNLGSSSTELVEAALDLMENGLVARKD